MVKGVKKASSKTVAKKKTTRKKAATRKPAQRRRPTTKTEDRKLEKMLVENFISMQNIMTHLVTKFDKLNTQMSSLLELFEDSAKTVAEKEINLEIKGNEENQKIVMQKLQNLLDQNKLIAKGITLMHEAATNPQVQYSIGQNPSRVPETQERRPQQMQNSMMKPSAPMEQKDLFPNESPKPEKPEVTSPIKTPKVMEEESSSPTFSI